jgi:hypothetical protein
MASEEAVQSGAAKEAPRVGDGEKSTGVVGASEGNGAVSSVVRLGSLS